MRSASSTCAGRPVDMRPATYLTRGENARTSCSRARWSSSSLYLRHKSRSSMDLTFVSRAFPLPYGRGIARSPAFQGEPDSTRFGVGLSLPSLPVGAFFINYEDGRIATRDQLAEASLVDEEQKPV